MNNTLNINRFGKVLKHDGLNFFPKLILTLAILWAIPVIVYLFAALMPTNDTKDAFDAMSRIDLISTLTSIALIIAPARLYRHCNDSRKGIGYAMLPASTLEKFLSMVFYCVVVTPIIYVAGALAIDSILALFQGPYEGFAAAYYFDRYAKLDAIFTNDNAMLDASLLIFFKSISPTFMIALSMLGTLTISSIFMFGNMIFKKRKTGKMLGILILLFIIFMIVIINLVANNEALANYFNQMNEENMAEFIKHFTFIAMNVGFYTEIIISALMLFGVYRKIKTQKY
ncbi:MAG: hypothetical protein J5686_02955 [Bacteroidales bacterium]|nr:hypothetical protein [Bacteroidales bacterium]